MLQVPEDVWSYLVAELGEHRARHAAHLVRNGWAPVTAAEWLRACARLMEPLD